MSLLIGALIIGLILSLLALGVYISFRIFDFPDITTDGSITTGAAVTAILLVKGVSPFIATGLGFVCGMAAGVITGVLYTKFKINKLLAGILVMTALYSINLHIMGKSNIPLINTTSLVTHVESIWHKLFGKSVVVGVLGWDVSTSDLSVLVSMLLLIAIVGYVLYLFLKTNIGTAMRATGDNPQMITALGVNVENMTILGIALANGLIALSGSLLAQFQGFADVQMGIGMIIWGLASIIIGQALVGTQSLGYTIAGAVIGSVLFRLLVAIALRVGVNPNDLKLITAVFVFIALVLPSLISKLSKANARLSNT
ncbi:MAG: ABC transporter permease [Candidatus Dadabacteria bacterium]|nr:ABC transporter permease [Candidatus Dadabacteria bacterium]